MTAVKTLSRAIERNAGKSTRSEDLEDFADFLADPIGLESIAGNANAVIFGRRGAGKTLVAGALADAINSGLVGERVMAFRYSADSFRTSPQFSGGVLRVKDEARAYFNAFLHSLMVDLSEAGTARLYEDSRWTDGFTRRGGDARRRREEFLNLLIRYDELVRFGVPSGEPVAVRQTLTRSEGRISASEGSAGLTLTGDLSEPGARMDLKATKSSGSTKSYAASMEIELERRFAPARIRDLIVTTIKFMELDYIVILIDEWMTLGECQIEFAERLRRTLFGDMHIAVKIAADQYQGVFNNGAPSIRMRGFELGADVMVSTDLDLPFSDPARREKLFALALFKRLHKFEPGVGQWFSQSDDPGFIASLFATKHAFSELCVASNGLCRDFFVLFRLCTKELDFEVTRTKRIDIDIVRAAILENYRSTYNRALEHLPIRTVLFEVIVKHLKSVQSRYFLVPNSQGGMNNPVLRELLAKRFLVHIPPTQFHDGLRSDYSCFGLDYSMYVEMMRTIEFSTGRGIDDIAGDDITQLTPTNAAAYILDLSALETIAVDTSATCGSCGSNYVLTDPHVTKLNVCPICLDPIPDTTQEKRRSRDE